MELKKIECPACGGIITIPEDQDTCFCTYCGRQLAVEGRMVLIVKQHQIIEDKARLRELELAEAERIRKAEETEREKQREAEEKHRFQKARKTWWTVLLVDAFAVLPVTLFFLWPFKKILNNAPTSVVAGFIIVIFVCCIIVIPIVLAVKYPEKPEKPIKRGWLWFGLSVGVYLSWYLLALFIGSLFGELGV